MSNHAHKPVIRPGGAGPSKQIIRSSEPDMRSVKNRGCVPVAAMLTLLLLFGCRAVVTEFREDGVTPLRKVEVPWPQEYRGESCTIRPGDRTVDAATSVVVTGLTIGGEAVANRMLDTAAEAAKNR